MLARLDHLLAPTERAATALLWLLAIVAAVVALGGSPTLKAALAGWMVLP